MLSQLFRALTDTGKCVMSSKTSWIGDVANVIKDWDASIKKRKGDSRVLLSEIKKNHIQIKMLAEHEIPLDEVVQELLYSEYERLQREGFEFDEIKPKRIPKIELLQESDLESWIGKTTGELVDSIYEKIIELKMMHPKLKNSSKFRGAVRANNIGKRISLLLEHVRS